MQKYTYSEAWGLVAVLKRRSCANRIIFASGSSSQKPSSFHNNRVRFFFFFNENTLKPHVSDAFTTRADSSSDTFFSLKLGRGGVFTLKRTAKELSKLDFNTLLHNSAFNIYFEELLTQKKYGEARCLCCEGHL